MNIFKNAIFFICVLVFPFINWAESSVIENRGAESHESKSREVEYERPQNMRDLHEDLKKADVKSCELTVRVAGMYNSLVLICGGEVFFKRNSLRSHLDYANDLIYIVEILNILNLRLHSEVYFPGSAERHWFFVRHPY